MEKIFIAQSKHETANWKSDLFKNHNSLFGMKVSKEIDFPGYVGPVSPEGDNYAGYDKWSQSAQHLLNWLRAKDIPVTNSVDEYVKSLRSKVFFTDTIDNYANGIKRFL